MATSRFQKEVRHISLVVHFLLLPASFCRHPSLNVHGATDLLFGCNTNETFASRKTLIYRGFVAYSVSTFPYSPKCNVTCGFAGCERVAPKAMDEPLWLPTIPFSKVGTLCFCLWTDLSNTRILFRSCTTVSRAVDLHADARVTAVVY